MTRIELNALKATVRNYMADDRIREYGDLRKPSTWEAAYAKCSEAIALAADAALSEVEPEELADTDTLASSTQYGPELIVLIPVLVLILTAQLIWRGIRWVWPKVSCCIYHECIGGLTGTAVLRYRPRLAL